jgi:hypothetical protein
VHEFSKSNSTAHNYYKCRGFSQRLNPKLFLLGFIVDKVAMIGGFLQALVFHANVIQPLPYKHISLTSTDIALSLPFVVLIPYFIMVNKIRIFLTNTLAIYYILLSLNCIIINQAPPPPSPISTLQNADKQYRERTYPF